METNIKKLHLTIHVFPKEIDDYNFTINQLKSAFKLTSNLEIDANVILNVNPNVVNWEATTIPKEHFIEKFKFINKKLDWVNDLEEEISEDYNGYLEKRVNNTKLEGYDAFWWQDVDLVLDDLLLYGIEYGLNNIQDNKFILSPQCHHFWDPSWDVLSYSKSQDNIHVNEFDPFNIKQYQFNRENISLNKNFNIKFAGGWGTIISNDLIKEVPFPFHVKGYGREDTLVATWAYKHRYPQYILNNVIVQENRKYRCTFLYDNQIYYNTEFLTTNNEISKNHYYSLIDKILS